MAGVLAGFLMSGAQNVPKPTPTPAPPPAQAPAPAPATQTPAAPPVATPPTAPAAATPSPPAVATSPAPAAPVVPRVRLAFMLDAAHGGEELGAALSDKINEKDVALAFARRIRTELANRGATAMMVRDADTTIPSDQRAQMVNAWRPAVYLAVHVSSVGSGVRLYTALLPEAQAAPVPWQAWERGQQNWLDASQAVAQSVAADLGEHEIGASVLAAPLRPLNNIAAVAVALELAPPPGGKATIDRLTSAPYQQRMAAAVAAALLAAREKAGERP